MKTVKILFLFVITSFVSSKVYAAASCRATLYTDRGVYLTSVNRRGYNISEACSNAYQACLDIRYERLDDWFYDFDKYYYSSCETDLNWSVPNHRRLVRRSLNYWHTRRGNGYRPRFDDHRGRRYRDGRRHRRDDRRGNRRGDRRGRRDRRN